jgi:hypothetical protein
VRELDSPCKLAYSAGRAEFMHPTRSKARSARDPFVRSVPSLWRADPYGKTCPRLASREISLEPHVPLSLNIEENTDLLLS